MTYGEQADNPVNSSEHPRERGGDRGADRADSASPTQAKPSGANPVSLAQVQAVLGASGDVRHLMTSAYDDERAGIVVRSIQVCADDPLLISVAVRKGHTIEPVIRDSHAFAICRISPDDRLLIKKFSETLPPDENEDPFVSLSCGSLATGSPVLTKSKLVLDCEVVRHFDLEADCELYIGAVVAARTPEA